MAGIYTQERQRPNAGHVCGTLMANGKRLGIISQQIMKTGLAVAYLKFTVFGEKSEGDEQ
jgi:hypothetical protein